MAPDPAPHDDGQSSASAEDVIDVALDGEVVPEPEGEIVPEPEGQAPSRRRKSFRRRLRRARLRVRFTVRQAVRSLRGSVAPVARTMRMIRRVATIARLSPAPIALVVGCGAFIVAVSVAPLSSGLRLAGWLASGAVALLGVAVAVYAERALRSASRARQMIRYARDLIVVSNEAGVIREQSSSGAEVLGYARRELVGLNLLALSHPDDADAAGRLLQAAAAAPGDGFTVELRMRHADGSWRYVEARARSLLNEPEVAGIVAIFRDVSERRALEEEVAHRAFHDSLTGLANRALFKDRVDHALSRRGNPLPAVLLVDLDGFKAINDSLGHAAGDELLVVVGERLRECVRPEDTLARLGGDEFAVLLDDVADPRDVSNVARRIIRSMQEPFSVGDKEVFVTASVGVAVHETEGLDQLLRDADVALYMAKTQGKGRCVVFDMRTHSEAIDNLQIEADLRRAVERGEFVLHYQPVVELRSERIVGVEALLRWNHPERGLLQPGDFLPVAEESDLMMEIGRWVVEQASAQSRKWQRAFPVDPPLSVSVNLSATELRTGSVVEDLARASAEWGPEHANLVLEFNETMMLGDADATISVLKELKQLGVKLAVDDFGAGQSSLAHLQRFPVDFLKIDPSFVDGLDRGPEDSALARAIVRLAQVLRLEVVAEGVEREEQLTALRELGCQMAQGFLFARPLDEPTMTAVLERAAAIGKLGPAKRKHAEAAPGSPVARGA
ncbi:MAG TPA: EAL domain-containing protein [Actinomycetota bacterium]|nr:EAL domain-containing protein [Actinomycetota bacterium]